jgi:hypothetical protein
MLSYIIDTSDVKVFIERFALESDAATILFFKQARYEIQIAITQTFQELSGYSEGFPEPYIEHLIEQVNMAPPIRDYGTGGLEVDLNMLGTYINYTAGFHRHAIGADNERIELPYEGQALKTTDRDIRAAAWEEKVVGNFLYNETIFDRVQTWKNMGVAPEWWVLQNGSPDDPFVAPTPVEELISAKLIVVLAALMEQAQQEAVNRSDHGWATTSKGGFRHAERGGYSKNRGQFSPHTL